MKKLITTSATVFLVSISLFLNANLYGWENKKTHPALTDEAIGVSSIDDYLKIQLGLDNGIGTELYWNFPTEIRDRIKWGETEPDKTTRTILEWIKVGSTIEDEDGCRRDTKTRRNIMS